MSIVMFFLFSLQENLTFDCVSTFSSVVIFLFLNDVVTSPKKASQCFAPRVVKDYMTQIQKHVRAPPKGTAKSADKDLPKCSTAGL